MTWLNTDPEALHQSVFKAFAEVVADGKGLVTPVPEIRQVAELDIFVREDPDDLVIRVRLSIGPFRHAARVIIERLDIWGDDALLEKVERSGKFLGRLVLAGKVPLVREGEECRTFHWKDVENDHQS